MCVHLPKELINCFKTPKDTVGVKVSMNGVLKIFLTVVRKQKSIQENKVDILFIVLDCWILIICKQTRIKSHQMIIGLLVIALINGKRWCLIKYSTW